MRVLQQPGAVGLLFGSEQLDGFVHPLVGGIPGGTEVLQGTEHVVVQRVGNENCSQAGSATSPVLLRRNSFRSRRYSSPRRRAAMDSAEPPVARSCASSPSSTRIVVANEERTVLHPAVPPAVLELLTDQAGDNAIDILVKVRTERDDHPR
jgi:hypothetical protein